LKGTVKLGPINYNCNKPFWITDVSEHKKIDILAKGNCFAHIYVSNTFILLGCFIGYSPQNAMAQNMKSNLVTETALSNDSNQTPQ
jgi:hypothetical protein